MAQENIIAMILFYFCTIGELQNAANTITFKVSSDYKIHEVYTTITYQCQQVTQLLAELLVTIAVCHVQQSIAILECGAVGRCPM